MSPVDRARRRRRRSLSRAVYTRRRAAALVAAGTPVLAVALLLASGSRPGAAAARVNAASRSPVHSAALKRTKEALLAAAAPVVSAPTAPGPAWSVVARVAGQPAVWLTQRGGVTLLRFDQAYVRVDLHAGSLDGGVTGWKYGNQITRREIHRVIAGFNGGFKLTYANVGFVAGGHVAVPLKSGLASIVTYSDGRTDIGAWRAGVPQAGAAVFSVLQNQSLLVDHASPAANVECVSCWGETIGGRTVVARSGLGVTASGQLVWAAGEQLLPRDLASALVRAGAVRAIELDINPDWVAAYLYVHRAGGPSAEPVVPRQLGIAGRLLEPYSRDFLTIVAR